MADAILGSFSKLSKGFLIANRLKDCVIAKTTNPLLGFSDPTPNSPYSNPKNTTFLSQDQSGLKIGLPTSPWSLLQHFQEPRSVTPISGLRTRKASRPNTGFSADRWNHQSTVIRQNQAIRHRPAYRQGLDLGVGQKCSAGFPDFLHPWQGMQITNPPSIS